MSLNQQTAAEIARRYLKSDALPEPLGWGIGGFVYLSPQPGRVVKVHRGEKGFRVELEVYRRLRRLRMTQLHGLNVPTMYGFDEKEMVLEMDFVSAPFLLDFAGVLFSPPDFERDVMEKWHADINAAYGPNAWVAYSVYESLSKHGIYYMDFRITNMKLDGLPGIEPYTPPSIDDLPW
jgi:hypothetical protein